MSDSSGNNKMSEECATPSPSIEEVLARLESVVEELEGGELSLESALERFEKGIALVREGGNMLDEVQQRVDTLLANRQGTEPFEAKNESGDE